jgi:hypothetical protein
MNFKLYRFATRHADVSHFTFFVGIAAGLEIILFLLLLSVANLK